ncbi:MAG: hypothetical protein ACE5JP_18500 [Candidatus Bipolaricaulia bacterium]
MSMTLIYPAIVALVSLVFGLVVYGQYRTRHRPYQLIWAISLWMSFIASIAYILAMAFDHVLSFQLYYLFGALLMAAYLGLGSIYLVASKRVAIVCLGGIIALSVIGTVLLFQAPIDRAELAALEGGPGRDVIGSGAWLPVVIVMNSFGLIAVAGIALYSAWQLFHKQAAANYVWGNVLIAIGVIVLGAAGSAARLGRESGFWWAMTLGWVVAFAGFLVISTTVPARQTSTNANVSHTEET